MPLHFLCSLQLSPGFTKQLDMILRQCIWRDFENENMPSLAACEIVCKSKQKAGLGIVLPEVECCFVDQIFGQIL
jgi:hypothetical protein